MSVIERLKGWAQQLKLETAALVLACQDARTPWYAKALALLVAAYSLSPIDLIPDFIPVLGYLDDLILVPLGLALAVRLIPREVLSEAREQAEAQLIEGSWLGRVGTLIVVGVWAVVLLLVGLTAYRTIRRSQT